MQEKKNSDSDDVNLLCYPKYYEKLGCSNTIQIFGYLRAF